MTCKLCLKQTCRHQEPHRDEESSRGRPRTDDLPSVGTRGPGNLSTNESASLPTTSESRSLFELVGLRDLRCRSCQYLVVSGPYQTALRYQHGRMHVARGQAVAIRDWLPADVVRFEIVEDR
jgi:hypothetical protein